MYTLVASKKKQKLIDAFEKTPLKKGEYVSVKGKLVEASQPGKDYTCKIISVGKTTIRVERVDINWGGPYTIKLSEITSRDSRHIGEDPFIKECNQVVWVQFDLGSIVNTLDLLGEKQETYTINGIHPLELNGDPYVFIGGKKQRYQRPFVWTLEQKQAFLSSMYNNVDCGKIIVRQRSHEDLLKLNKSGETELAFHDIVDGKQRLKTIQEFLLGAIKDEFGNFYGDLSEGAQVKFLRQQSIGYGLMRDGVTDADVLRQFLKMNFSGIPQSPEHMKFVQSLYKKVN